MRIDVVTIFPGLFDSFLETSLVGRGRDKGLLDVRVHDLRAFAHDRHRCVDDEPYGGGGGMVMRAPPWIEAMRSLDGRPWRILLSPQGARLNEEGVRLLANRSHLALMCGRYEGIDERVRQTVVDEEISIGDYVLSGGELAAMVVIEAVSRQIPGVVGQPESVENDSFRRGLLDHPHYTRPAEVERMSVPEVLMSGDHARIERWRTREALRATALKRPELLASARLTPAERRELECLRDEELKDAEGLASSPSKTR